MAPEGRTLFSFHVPRRNPNPNPSLHGVEIRPGEARGYLLFVRHQIHGIRDGMNRKAGREQQRGGTGPKAPSQGSTRSRPTP